METKPSYEELAGKLAELEEVFRALRSHEVDAVVGTKSVFMLRLRETEDAIKKQRTALEELLAERGRLLEDAKARQAQLQRKSRELEEANTELQQFAYVASHDLREPLRMIAGFTQSLEKRYRGTLDTTADEYITFIVDGVARMQDLINDLLAYSRVGTRGVPFEPVGMEDALQNVLINLKTSIGETAATVTHGPLPVIQADPIQMMQVLQNLISNAIKFHRADAPPVIHVTGGLEGGEWVFSVRDNGIGIDPEFFGRLFTLFQRLHTREQYPGSGLGLAITKKIVGRHGGRVWVESEPGKGSTFHFSVAAGNGRDGNAEQ